MNSRLMEPLRGKRKLDFEAQTLIMEIEKESFFLWVKETVKTLESRNIQEPTDQQIADNMSLMKETIHNPVDIKPEEVKSARNNDQYDSKDVSTLEEEIRQFRRQLVFTYFEYTWKKIKKEYWYQPEYILGVFEEIYLELLEDAADEVGGRRDGLGENGEHKPDRKEGNYHFRFNPNSAIYYVNTQPCSYWWNWAWKYFIKTGLNKKITNLTFYTGEKPLSYDYDSKGYLEKHHKIYKEIKQIRKRLVHKLLRQPTENELWEAYHDNYPTISEEDFGKARTYEYLKIQSIHSPISNSEDSQTLEDTLKSEEQSIFEEVYARFSERDILTVAAVIFEDPFEYQLVEHHILNPDDELKFKELANQKKLEGEVLSLLLNDRLGKLFRIIKDCPFLSLDINNPSKNTRNQAEKQLKELIRIDQAEKEVSLGPLFNLYTYVKEQRSNPPAEDIALDLNVLLLRVFDKKLGEQIYKSADMRTLSKTLRNNKSLKAVFYLGQGNFREELLSEHEAIQALLRGYLNWLLWCFGGYKKQVEYKVNQELSQLLPTSDHFIIRFTSEESAQLAISYLEDWRLKPSKNRGKRLMIFDSLLKKGAFKNLDKQQLSLFIPDELHDLWNKKMKEQRAKDLTLKGNHFKSVNTENNARHQATIANYIAWQFFLGACVATSETDLKNIALKTV